MTLNRSAVVRWLADRHGLRCTEGLLRHYEDNRLLDQASGASVYESRALAILRARRDGTPLEEISRALGVDRDNGAVLAIEQDCDDDEFERRLNERIEELVSGGMPKTEAASRILAADRATFTRRRQIMLRIGKRLAAREGIES